MTTTLREAMLVALQDLLKSLESTVPELKVGERNRRAPMKDDKHLVLHDGGQTTDATAQTEFKNHIARPEIAGRVIARNDAEIGTEVNALYGAIIDRLEADPSLGGTADDVLEVGFETEFDTDPDAKVSACDFRLMIEVHYTALRIDSSQA